MKKLIMYTTMMHIKEWLQKKIYEPDWNYKEIELPESASEITERIINELHGEIRAVEGPDFAIEVLPNGIFGGSCQIYLDEGGKRSSETIETERLEYELEQYGIELVTDMPYPMVHDTEKMKIRHEILNKLSEHTEATHYYVGKSKMYFITRTKEFRSNNWLAKFVPKPDEEVIYKIKYILPCRTLNLNGFNN